MPTLQSGEPNVVRIDSPSWKAIVRAARWWKRMAEWVRPHPASPLLSDQPVIRNPKGVS